MPSPMWAPTIGWVSWVMASKYLARLVSLFFSLSPHVRLCACTHVCAPVCACMRACERLCCVHMCPFCVCFCGSIFSEPKVPRAASFPRSFPLFQLWCACCVGSVRCSLMFIVGCIQVGLCVYVYLCFVLCVVWCPAAQWLWDKAFGGAPGIGRVVESSRITSAQGTKA